MVKGKCSKNLDHYLFASSCRLLIIFANSFDPDKAPQNVGPNLDPNCLTHSEVIPEFFFEIVNFGKK